LVLFFTDGLLNMAVLCVRKMLAIGLLSWVIAVASLSGCSTSARLELPVPIELSITASEALNPTAQGRPSPVLLRVYELSDATFFQAANFFTLLGEVENAQHAEVIKIHEFMLMPGEVRLLRRRTELNTRFLAVAAAYQDLPGSMWRSVAALPPPYRAGRLWSAKVSPQQTFRVVVGAKRVTIERLER